VENEYTLHLYIVLAICVLKIIKFGADLTKFWQKQVGSFMMRRWHSRNEGQCRYKVKYFVSVHIGGLLSNYRLLCGRLCYIHQRCTPIQWNIWRVWFSTDIFSYFYMSGTKR